MGSRMSRTATTITFSQTPEIADRVEEIVKQQGSSRSELLHEALLHYIEEYEWRQLLKYGEQKQKEQSIQPDDVVPLVEEYRAARSY